MITGKMEEGRFVLKSIGLDPALDNPLLERWFASHAPVAQIEEIAVLATSVLENRDLAIKWLSQPNVATDNRPPVDLIGEKDGFERVKNLLLRIEYGALA